MTTDPATMLTAAQVAERLGISTRTVSRMVARGDLTPAHKLPGDTGAYLFDAATIPEPVGRRKKLPSWWKANAG